jgi:cytochrome bd ubiquinol oxidase subunit II
MQRFKLVCNIDYMGKSMVILWVSILALSILLCSLLYEFDLAIGILLRFTRREESNGRITTSTVAPIWDDSEKWLMVAGIAVCGAFPIVCATILSAFYLPFLLMLAGLIVRGAALWRRDKTQRLPWLWAAAAFASFIVAFMQGLMVGALVEALIISHSKYSGDEVSWWSFFAVLCGIGGLFIGYALLGACWLMRKYTGDDRTAAYRLIPALSLGSLLAVVFVFVYSMAANLRLLSH